MIHMSFFEKIENGPGDQKMPSSISANIDLLPRVRLGSTSRHT